MWADKAAFTRAMVEQARSEGHAQFAHRLRAILRTGRRYRAPALLPCLSDEPEQPMEKDHVADSFGLYFAQAERATPVPVEQLTAACRQSEPIATVIRGSELPSLASLASGFASLQTGKAAGLSGLPPEVYRACPLRQAILYYPVVCKLFLRDPSPFQWRGGLSVCVPKPNKPSTRHQGYRAIMLLEGDNKALQKSMRSALLGAMPIMGVPDQMGGRPGYTLTHPAAYVKAHMSRLRRTRRSGAVIFIDAAAAYYSIAKDLLAITPAQRHDRAFLEQRAATLFSQADLRCFFVEHLLRSEEELSQAMSPELRSYLQKQLDATWYVPRHNSPIAYVAGSGTAPGSPLAEVMFSLIFGDLLCQTRQHLVEHGWHSGLADALVDTPGYTPTWADDVSILLETERASSVPEAVTVTVGFFLDRMHRAGLHANHGAGKTEAMLCLHGPGARAVRQQLFSQEEPALPFRAQHVNGAIRLAATYDYLGTTVQADGHSLPDILRRRGLARDMYRPLKARVLRNPALTRSEKIDLLRSRVLSRFLHGSGLWSVGTTKEAETIGSAINGFYRGAFQPIFGIKSQGYTSLEIAGALGIPTPSELLAVERVRAASRLASDGFRAVLEELTQDSHWWTEVVAAAALVGLTPTTNPVPEQVVSCLLVSKAQVKSACKAFLRKQIASRHVPWETLRPRPACDTVVITAASSAALPWRCQLCPSAFADRRRLAVHESVHHGLRTQHAISAVGSRCEVCTREYWSRFIGSLSICGAVRAACGSTQKRKYRVHASAWRPCVQSHGPRPWWATLNP